MVNNYDTIHTSSMAQIIYHFKGQDRLGMQVVILDVVSYFWLEIHLFKISELYICYGSILLGSYLIFV